MIIEHLGFIVSPANGEQLKRALSSLVGPIQAKRGCLSCRLHQEADNPDSFHMVCSWETREDLVQHIGSEVYKRLLVLMELGVAPPVVEFHDVIETQGLDFIHKVRQSPLRAPRNTGGHPVGSFTKE
jgi:quinol monooxygenase YgiN